MEKLEKQLEFEFGKEEHKIAQNEFIKKELKKIGIAFPIYIGSGLLLIEVTRYLEKTVPQIYETISSYIKSLFYLKCQ